MEAEFGKDRLVPARFQSVPPPKEFAEIQAADLVGWNGSIDDPRVKAFVRKICERVGKQPDAPVDMIEALRDLRELPAIPDATRALAQTVSVQQEHLLSDLRRTWESFQSRDDLAVVERFFEHVARAAPGTGLEFEVKQHLEISRSKTVDLPGQAEPPRETKKQNERAREKKPKGRLGIGAAPSKQEAVRQELPRGRVIGVASGKGGVGTTWLATTLACAFARSGRRTLLVDADLGSANVDVILGIAPETDLAAVIAGWVELEDAIAKVNGGAGSTTGFDVLPGRSGSGALAGLPAEEVSRLAASISALAIPYDVVVVDLPTGIGDDALRMARACDECIVVSTDEPPSMTDAFAFLKVLEGYAPSVRPWLLANMADTPVAGRRTIDALLRASKTFLKRVPLIAGVVLRDLNVRAAVRAQRTIFSFDETTQAAKDVQAIANKLTAEM